MDEFCGSKFWDWDLTWYTTDPDLTPCFQKTVLVWIPSGFLFVSALLYHIFQRRRPEIQIPWSVFNITKVGICIILIVLQIVKLTDTVRLDLGGSPVYALDLYTPIVELCTYGLTLADLLFCKSKGLRSSGVQFTFWLFRAIFETFPFVQVIRHNKEIAREDLALFLVQVISYPLIVGQFLLSCWADNGSDATEGIQKKGNENEVCPRKKSSPLNRLTFSWFDALAWLGYKQPLEMQDLWKLDPEYSSSTIVGIFDRYWDADVKQNEKLVREGKQPRPIALSSILFRSFGAEFLFGSSMKMIPDLLAFVSPQILNLLILFVNGNEEVWKGYFYASLLLVTDLFSTLGRNHYNYRMFMIMFKLKSSLMSAVYRKALVVSNAARKEKTVGEIVNLMSVDVQKILDLAPYVNFLWSSPLQIIIATYFLWTVIGPSALAGVGVMLLLIPINAVITTNLRRLQVAQMKLKDERVKLMAEILSGMKILKLYAWEPSFQQEILRIREKEVATLRSMAYLSAIADYFFTCSQFMVTLATFATYVFVDSNNVLDARTAFVSLALLNVMSTPLTAFPMVLIFTVQAAVSMRRLSAFINSDEINFGAVTHDSHPDPVVVENASFTWDENEGKTTLENISLRVSDGSLVAIVGTVGSGKSSLLAGILGEMTISSGKVNTIGNISYAAQQPWIQNETLRENILFGKPYEPLKYDRVIDACCLCPDLDIFPGRDKIEIGEKGINLSGGQKQRVSVARAVYNNANIYVFDDPLSAVDAHVGKRMFEKVLGPSGILRRKTRILVTHSVTFLPQVDQIVVLKDGKISETGTYQELVDKQGEFSEFLAQYMNSEQNHEEDGNEKLRIRRMSSVTSDRSVDFDGSPRKSVSFSSSGEKTKEVSEVQKLIAEETSETTSIPWSIYYRYFQAGGWIRVILAIAAYIIFQSCAVGANIWLSMWSEVPTNNNGTQPDQGFYVGIYGALGVTQSLGFIVATALMCLTCVQAAAVFQSEMLARILKAPMWFFDTTPTGRILNRFAKDVDVLDTTLSFIIRNWVYILVQVLGTLFIIVFNLPIFLAVLVPLAVLFYLVQKFYIPTSRQVKRLESVTRSPIYAHFSETINGTQTIRAYKQQERFILKSQGKVDDNLVCFFPTVVSNRWLMLRLECIGSLVVFFTATFAVMNRETLNSGAVGLSITYALSVTVLLSYLVRNFCDVETNIVAVERLAEYCEAPQEANWESLRKPMNSWPAYGSVQYENYQTVYREGLDPVLKNVSFEIQPGEKVGVVGRTGAGKSSMTLALFRIVEATNGSITIDGENIGKLGLHDLRSKLTIIPQDPVLFSGSLRFNLDPFKKFSDRAIWEALELAHLNKFVSSLPAQLEHPVSEGGDNLSMGQKQLVCLARALLRKSKILVLDEATAAVDLETDDLIQETIRSEFKESTVITIAHRINTVLDSTRILVLDEGNVKEFDTPAKLLADSNSRFYQMAKDANVDLTGKIN